MKKRSMLAIASLATGFVVAAITPSHAADDGPLDDLHISDTLEHVGHLVGEDSFQTDRDFLGQE
ncbi:hypothetical protein ABT075_44285 [Streptomyces sp. NPDC002677]|jgi:hypothetical protein|uniref:hypothetical protein n=1 Tax=Streptomyces sp. NPDC002677 TaxID=3154774 RepID=UPI00331676F0